MDVLSGDLCPVDPYRPSCPTLASLLSVLDKGSALLWTTDLELRLNSITGGAWHKAHYDTDECAGQRIDELFPGTALDAHKNALAGANGQFDFRVNGQELVAHVEPLRGSDGAILGVIGLALSSTERLVAERALRLSEQNYRSLIEEAPYAICRVTRSGQMLQVNRAMLDMLQYGPGGEADLLERDLPVIFAVQESFTKLQKELLENHTAHGVETAWLRSDGRRIQVRLGGRAVRNSAGQLLYFDIIAEDITERKLLEAQLNQSQKMQAIGQLAGGVAHDFNNLLTVIAGQLEVVLSDGVTDEVRSRLQDARRAAERATALTRQLLAFSRRQVLQNVSIDLNELIAHLCQMLTRLIREDITLRFIPGIDIGLVKADSTQLEQVLINMTVNAQDAMPEGGILTLETEAVRVPEHQPNHSMLAPGDYVRISVRDTGCGMDQETQSHVFEPFFTTKPVGKGTGLGLSMAYGVVRQSGGHISVESQPGQGSRFHVYLPRTAAEESAVPEFPIAPSPQGGETILLAEDEESVRNLVSGYLESLGYRVLAACDGITALELAYSHQAGISLLLSDLVMPKMSGRELAECLRKDLAGLKVIFVSGYAGHPSVGKEPIPDALFLQKPFSLQQLANTVREVLDSAEPTVSDRRLGQSL